MMITGRLRTVFLSSIFATLIFNTAANAENKPNPYLKPDETWISISGRVESVEPDSFMLDYGSGIVKVEMDDGDRDSDAYKLLEGDKVTVNGYIDDDFYELTKIEAGSVYVEKIDTYFYASSEDEETPSTIVWYTVPVDPGEVVVQGMVTEVNDKSFIVNNGYKTVEVNVSNMPRNPLDNEGFQKIEKGDVVRVTGDLNDDLFEDKEIRADSIVTLLE